MATITKIVRLPTLAEIIDDPAKAATLPKEAIPEFRGELARLDTILLATLLSRGDQQSAGLQGDRLLDVEAASGKLGTTANWLYRNASRLPFAIRVGKKQLRFSEMGIDRYIHQKAGR
jgi:predicted DNA-binding transcriptional regulator AlpA